MATTKNPMIMQSASYIYTWFLGRLTTSEEVAHINLLENVTSDFNVLKYIKKKQKKMEYNDKSGRLANVEEMLK